MTNKQALTLLKRYNKWRLGDEEIEMPNPKEITQAINIAIENIETGIELKRLGISLNKEK